MGKYYQILIETVEKNKKGDKQQYLMLDETDLDQIKLNVIRPYLQGEEFQFDGYLLKKEKITRFLIKTTERKIQEIAEDLTNKLPMNIIAFISPKDILSNIQYEEHAKNATPFLLEEVKNSFSISPTKEIKNIKNMDSKKVFIVHGRDDGAKLEVARFIEKLGLSPIILHEQPNMGKTIIEKIEAHADVGFAIILYTPCDEGRLKGAKNKPRARQNVVFEHGYFTAKLTRERVCALVKSDIEIPADLDGIIYIPLDNSQGWQIKIVQELLQAGYQVDINKIYSIA